ncbi:NAD(+) diphosphatase [Micromonospora globispora]|uniref:NAD(+) diphosphatase n=1 Tax=Micromonospora globispora TaxID=1450148 RepID=A0A317K1K1_9ACTN|nr:NAD(+) diphosphatase [Micromonospora globispora]PWU46755.1 NAD(+) diphosphatase [Micromonospora globispora]PWU55290.1 NAD(+) diphosphatase [Micromonospora globispora]RQW93431.1 NAD(+) diphosphatase [Micromonospora globispora]
MTGPSPGGVGSGFLPGADRTVTPAAADIALPVAGRKLLTHPDAGFPRVADLPADTAWVPVGTLDGVPAWAVEVADAEALPGRWRSWRGIAAELPEPLATLAGRALAVVTWRRTHRWCGACRAELADVPGETARRCPDCELYVPMQLSAAVLVAITRPGRAGGPDELLLVRHAYGPTGLWALVAGFVEAGESLEAAAHREVSEEVGLAIDRPTYFGSQPWAMSGPGTLLAGFTATAADPHAEPVVDAKELTQARWFPLDALPAELPPTYSISRWLIDAVAARARS